MTKKLLLISLVGGVLFALSCNKSSDFASFLDEEGRITVDFLELSLEGYTIAGDSVLTYNDSAFVVSHFAGNMHDPLFGSTDARFFLQFGISNTPDFSDGILDSVVLSLAYDTLQRGYGPYEQPQDLGVYRVIEDMSRDVNYYSTKSFLVGSSPIGTVEQFTPNFDSSVFVVEPSLILDTVNTNEYSPHLRIRLDDELGNELMAYDEATYASNTEFLSKMKGLSLAPLDGSGGVTHFDLRSVITRLNLYYTQRDTARVFLYTVSSLSVLTSAFSNNISGSLADQYLNNNNSNDSLLFVQSMNGPDAEIVLPDLSPLDGKSINLATIEFLVATLPGDDTVTYPPIQQMALYEQLENGKEQLITDALNFQGSRDFALLFGGAIERDEDSGIMKYKMNLTRQLQRMLRGEIESRIIVTNLNGSAQPTRVVLYGPGHSQYKPKLKVTFTEF